MLTTESFIEVPQRVSETAHEFAVPGNSTLSSNTLVLFENSSWCGPVVSDKTKGVSELSITDRIVGVKLHTNMHGNGTRISCASRPMSVKMCVSGHASLCTVVHMSGGTN